MRLLAKGRVGLKEEGKPQVQTPAAPAFKWSDASAVANNVAALAYEVETIPETDHTGD